MKLRTKGYLFIGLPMVLQLCITAFLFNNVAGLEKKISKELFAKRVVALANQAQASASDTMISMVTLRFSNSETARKSVQRLCKQSIVITNDLRQLAKQDRANQKLIEDYADDIDQFQLLVRDLLVATLDAQDKNLSFSRVLYESDFNLETVLTYRNMARAEQAVRKQYASQVGDGGPDYIRQQERLRLLLAGALAINVVLAIVLATIYGKSTVDRLNMLMSNVQSFSNGIMDMRNVPGDDEITSLNDQFRVIARRRLEAEQERGAVLQAVSHDIRGPVGTLNMAIKTLLRGHEHLEADEISTRLARLNAESNRLVDLCNAFLDLEKFDSNSLSLKLQTTNILLLFEKTREAVEGLTNETGQEIEIECDSSTTLECDEDRLIQVMVNLVSNATKFAPADSTIFLSCTKTPDGTILSVRDEGSGIPADEAKDLFEKFTQLKNAQGRAGSGLGLWICKRLVEWHGATIDCQSAVNGGTTFRITFKPDQSLDS